MKTKSENWFDWFASILLVALFSCVAIRMHVTQWTTNLEVIELLGLFGSVLGIMLGASRFTNLSCKLFALNYSIFFIPWQLGLLMGKGIQWDERLLGLIGRLSYSITEVTSNRPIQDPILFLTTMAVFFWILSMVAGYQLARYGRPWGQVFMLGLTLAIVDFYTPYQAGRDRFSGFFVFILLLLVARLYLMGSRKDWDKARVAVDPEIGYDLGRTVALGGLILVVAAWNVPTMVDALTPGTELQKQLAQQWEGVRDRIQNAVAGLSNPVSIISDYFGDEMALGTGGSQGNDTVFTASLPESRPVNMHLYWRARSMDYYDGSTWRTTIEKTAPIAANEWPYRYPVWEGHKELFVSITSNVASIRNIYSPGLPLIVSRPSDAVVISQADGTTDLLALVANPALRGGDSYNVRAWIATPTVIQLRLSKTNYSDEIKRRYLQLPSNLPVRITNLATDIVTKANANTPYDRVEAITNWLRENISYAETVPGVPSDRNILDWFLFDLKKGYCNYYATAEVVMLRSIGIPARLAVGYAEGEPDDTNKIFTIRRKDSHAWPEVYFEGYGWVEFEPTTAQPRTEYLSGELATDNIVPPRAAPNHFTEDDMMNENTSTGTGMVPNQGLDQAGQFITIIGVPVSAGLLIALFLFLQRSGKLEFLKVPAPVLITSNLERRGVTPPSWLKYWSTQLTISPMQRMYTRVRWMLILLGEKPTSSQTAAEHVATLVEVQPQLKEPAGIFLEEFQRDEYSPYPADVKRAHKAHRSMWRPVLKGAVQRLFKSE